MLDGAMDAAEDGATKGAIYGTVVGAYIGLVWRATWPPTPTMFIEIGGVAAGVAALGAMMAGVVLFAWNL
jgi:small basic protein